MEWTVEANNQLNAFPYFIRYKAKKLIIDRVRKENRELVEVEDVFLVGENKEIKDLLQVDKELNDLRGKNKLRMQICGGIRGCRKSIINTYEVAKVFYQELEKSNLLVNIELNRRKDLRAGISSCLNSCSQPQIQDIAIVGFIYPKVIKERCIGCGDCLGTCPLDLIDLNSGISIMESGCIGCGRCLGICRERAIIEREIGYRILVGGKLGLLPSLAINYKEVLDIGELREELGRIFIIFNHCITENIGYREFFEID